MRKLLFAFPVLLVSACAGADYGGTNYVTVQSGNETWKVVGAKDESNVEFEVVRPDGTKVTYRADSAKSSDALAAVVAGQQQLLTQLAPLLNAAVSSVVAK